MKLTKIVVTIGPACESEEMVEKLIRKGTNIFCFNFKHNTIKWHETMIERVRKTALKLNIPVGMLIDLQGPEIRIKIRKPELKIVEGEEYTLGEDPMKFDISLSHPDILTFIKDGQKVVADDGAFQFTLSVKDSKYLLKSESEGILMDKKGLNIPGADFPASVLVDRDLEGIELAARNKIDFVALSFVRSAEDINFLRRELEKVGAHLRVVAKIETQRAIEHLAQIIEASDVLMVARGDLGVEFPFEQVPYFQKKIIRECVERGKSVITATQMLESMIENPYPTRAEISDIANAVFDLTDAVMLSAESALGKYPSKAVSTMSQAVQYNEKIDDKDIKLKHEYDISDQTEVLCDAAYNLYLASKDENKISAFLVFTETGHSARTLSRYRPHAPIFAFAPTKQVASSLTINFAIEPFFWDRSKRNREVEHEDIRVAIDFLVKKKLIKHNQKVVVLYGDHWNIVGKLSTIKIVNT